MKNKRSKREFLRKLNSLNFEIETSFKIIDSILRDLRGVENGNL